jgi:hypothetical protein
VGSWFIPVASLWFPYENLTDLHRAVTPGAAGSRNPVTYRLWWGMWLAGSVTQWLTNAASQGETTLASMVAASTSSAIGEAFSGGSAVCAVLVVGDLTRRAVQARDDAVAESELR